MATKCIDIADNKRLNTTSPIAMGVFVAIFVVLTALVELGFMYLILLLVAFVFTQIFFQYKPRYIFLTMKFLTKNSYLTPSFHDEKYFPNEVKIKNVMNILNEYEYSIKNEGLNDANRKF